MPSLCPISPAWDPDRRSRRAPAHTEDPYVQLRWSPRHLLALKALPQEPPLSDPSEAVWRLAFSLFIWDIRKSTSRQGRKKDCPSPIFPGVRRFLILFEPHSNLFPAGTPCHTSLQAHTYLAAGLTTGGRAKENKEKGRRDKKKYPLTPPDVPKPLYVSCRSSQ